MAVHDTKSIINDFTEHMKKAALPLKSWYVGIASDVQQRLHGDHGVPKENHWFIWRQAVSSDQARAIEKLFLDKGCTGGPGGGDYSTIYVYAYVITQATTE